MDRATYDFGLQHGLPLEANPFPHLHTVVVSTTFSLPGNSVEVWRDLCALAAFHATASGPIYLC